MTNPGAFHVDRTRSMTEYRVRPDLSDVEAAAAEIALEFAIGVGAFDETPEKKTAAHRALNKIREGRAAQASARRSALDARCTCVDRGDLWEQACPVHDKGSR